MKLDIVGASNFVNRMFEACGKFQWAREFLRNALEANATRIEFGIEWQAVRQLGTYRRTVIDNGDGMTSKELLDFFSTLGRGSKKIGGIHDNFGVGAKIAALPWNPNGLIVISHKDNKASMIWIILDEASGEYELVEFRDPSGNKTYVIDADKVTTEDNIRWGEVAPEWARLHGTVVVLLGSDAYPDTVVGNPAAGEDDVKGLSIYLNTRFWDLTKVEVTVAELRSNKKNQWPQSPDEKDDARRPNNRWIQGARYYVVEPGKNGKLAHNDIALLADERVILEWYLWEGERPSIHTYAKEKGYIAIRYNDELFHISSGKVDFRHFGIIENVVQQNLTLIIEPQHYKDGGLLWGVHPDQSRNNIIFTGNGDKGVQISLVDWGVEFAASMPKPIHDAIQKARGGMTGSIEDEDYRKRLQDRFGKRWTMKMLVQLSEASDKTHALTPEKIESFFKKDKNSEGEGAGQEKARRQKKSIAVAGTDGKATEQEVPVDVPRYEFAQADDFEEPWHLAMWVPTHTEGPTVFVNVDSPILQESVEYHLKQYLDVYAEEVAETVRRVFGELAACKIAHSQMLKKHIPEQDIDRDYRSEKALTISLMGLLAEESVIAHRLKRLGQRTATVTPRAPVATEA